MSPSMDCCIVFVTNEVDGNCCVVAIDVVGAATAAIDVVGAATVAIDVVGAVTAAIDVVGAATAAIGVVGEVTVAIGVVGEVTAAIDDVTDAVTAAIDDVVDAVTAAIDDVVDAVTAAIDDVVDAVTAAIDDVSCFPTSSVRLFISSTAATTVEQGIIVATADFCTSWLGSVTIFVTRSFGLLIGNTLLRSRYNWSIAKIFANVLSVLNRLVTLT